MDGLILVGHGSLLCGARRALEAHAERLSGRVEFGIVEVAFLRFRTPTLSQAATRCEWAGAARVVVTPYSIGRDRLVEVDIPEQVAAAALELPGVRFVTAEPLGFDPRLADAILTSAHAAVAPEVWAERMRLAGGYCEDDPRCPLHATPSCPTSSGRAERAAPTEPPAVRAPDGAADALVVAAHGDADEAAVEPVRRLVEHLGGRRPARPVALGFLETSEPGIAAALEGCACSGARRVAVVPYLLHPGTHLAESLPAVLAAARTRRPDVELLLGDFAGRSPHVAAVLADRALTALRGAG